MNHELSRFNLVSRVNMNLKVSEADILTELKDLMNNERILPEPEYKCFSRYLASLSNKEFLTDEEILYLVNSHGVQLKNDVKYWTDMSNEENSNVSDKIQVPVLNLQDFVFKDIDDLVKKCQEMPSEWTVIQISKQFSAFDIIRKIKNKTVPKIHITRFSCGNLAERVGPYSVTIKRIKNFQENIFEVLENLIKTRREYYQMGRTCTKLHEAYNNTNSELMSFIKELETDALGQWKCLLHGRLEDSNLEKDTLNQVRKLMASFCEKEKKEFGLSEKDLDIIYHVTLSAHFMKNKDIFEVLKSILYKSDKTDCNTGELLLLVENLKVLNLSRDCALKRASYNPVILILDSEFEIVPWEMITSLSGQPVCRISSLHLLYALYKYHQPYIENGFRIVNVDCTFCLVNPGKDLESCEKQMQEFLKKKIPWAEVEIGKAPDSKHLVEKLKDCSTYLYCGHGSGAQYLKTGDLKKGFVKGLVLLFGCSSNIPRNSGGRTPHQRNTYTYITNGCPCIIGCIQDVGSTDADSACEEILNNFMPAIITQGSEKIVEKPKESNVLKALVSGKNVCSKYWSKSAFVARGIPCKTAVGDVDKILVEKFK